MAKTKDSQLRAQDRYNKKNTTQICIRLNKKTDKDIINYLDCLANKQGVIKALIRKHINDMEGE